MRAGRLRAAVRRMVRAERRALAEPAQGGTAVHETEELDPADRLRQTLEIVARIEQLEDSLPAQGEDAEFWLRGPVARRPQARKRALRLIPRREQDGWSAQAPGVQVEHVPVAADVVVLAKFDASGLPKFRAVYADTRRTLSARPVGANGVCTVTRAVESLQIAARHAPDLVPPLLGHGRLPEGLPYLVEGWARGRALGSSSRLDEALPELLQGLARIQRGHGISRDRLVEHWGEGFARRWEATRETGIVPAPLALWVQALIDRDARLRRSWTHGDLVASNVLRNKRGLVLIDLEHSQIAPIMNDAAKLHLFAADPARTLHLVLAAFAATEALSPDAYSPAEELALSHAQLISQYPRRHAALAGHARAEIYEKQVTRQVERLQQVHDLATA